MKGDFTRDPLSTGNISEVKDFTRVLMQQGRVQLDADWNALNAVLLNRFRSFITDLIGFHAGPNDNAGFMIGVNRTGTKLTISNGRYYVDGIASENPQEKYELDIKSLLAGESEPPYLVYLEVWEQHVTYVQNEAIAEVALHGLDTTTRAKVEWRVRIKSSSLTPADAQDSEKLVRDIMMPDKRAIPRLTAQARERTAEAAEAPCIVSPEARYRGTENQLYRVEIHCPGPANSNPQAAKRATFKWSRENGSVVFPIREITTTEGRSVVKLEHLGRDSRMSLQDGNWVEIVDDDYIYDERADPLLQVVEIDRARMEVTLRGKPRVDAKDKGTHPLLRRWDHRAGSDEAGEQELADGAVPIQEVALSDDPWQLLEDGIRIQFQSVEDGKESYYRTGDYWLIPARTVTGDVEWPRDGEGNPSKQKPRGVERHYAPLALLKKKETGDLSVDDDLRKFFKDRI